MRNRSQEDPRCRRAGTPGRTADTARVSSREGGLTLVEVMISLVILLFVSLALMQTALMSIEANMKNTVRDEAVGVADQRMAETGWATLASDPFPGTITAAACPPSFWTTYGPAGGVLLQRNVRGWATIPFCTNKTVTGLGATNKQQVNITVAWRWKGMDYTHRYISVQETP